MKTIEHARALAESLEASAGDIEYREGRFTVAGTDHAVGLFELAASSRRSASRVEGLDDRDRRDLAEEHATSASGDRCRDRPRRDRRLRPVNDIGRVVSPTIVRGQVEAAPCGIGQALCEQMVYDKDSGQLLTASFLDYAMPRADGFRGFKTEFDTSIPCKTSALGAKGVGELGTIGATPAVVNGIVDALASAGLGRDAERIQMPVTAERVWRALARDFGPALFG